MGLDKVVADAVDIAFDVAKDFLADVTVKVESESTFDPSDLSVSNTATDATLKALLYDEKEQTVNATNTTQSGVESVVGTVRKCLIKTVDLPTGVVIGSQDSVDIAGVSRDVDYVERVPANSIVILHLKR